MACFVKSCVKLLKHNLKSITLKMIDARCLHLSNVQHSEGVTYKNKENNNLNTFRNKLVDGPNLKDFIQEDLTNVEEQTEIVPYLQQHKYGNNRKVYFEVHGCQMNVNDTEIIWSILKSNDFKKTTDVLDADVILIVTCAIRESAETKIWNKINHFKNLRDKRAVQRKNGPRIKIGVLGCMAERLKERILEKEQSVDIVAGPDSYKDLPRLLALTENNQVGINVMLSLDETYADVTPVRLNENSISAFVSIMRGCDNMCTYCIVPFTRGRERSRPVDSILREVEHLISRGVKEITLLGQNVNSYRDVTSASEYYTSSKTQLADGFKTVYKHKVGGMRFADLLDKVAAIDPEVRIRFTSPHPKDFPDDVLQVIKQRHNICNNLHMPAQSGSSTVLERMRRGYTRESYLKLVTHIREVIPNVSLSTDMICGFCGETDEEFQETLTLMEIVRYNCAYLFPYSMREKTTAHRRYRDDVPLDVKKKRMQDMIKLHRNLATVINTQKVGQLQLVLVEGVSRRSTSHLVGRNDNNIKVIFSDDEIFYNNSNVSMKIKPGDYIVVQVNNASSQVLKGIPLYHTTLTEFYKDEGGAGYKDYISHSSVL